MINKITPVSFKGTTEKIAENNNLKLIKISYKNYDTIDNLLHKIIFGSTTNQTV